MNAPGCSAMITGAGAAGRGLGAQTLSLRQFSSPENDGVVPKNDTWAQLVGMPVALSTEVHGTGGCGGFHRLAPAGDAAYGIPRNAHDAPRFPPWTSPSASVTKQDGCAPAAGSPASCPAINDTAPTMPRLAA